MHAHTAPSRVHGVYISNIFRVQGASLVYGSKSQGTTEMTGTTKCGISQPHSSEAQALQGCNHEGLGAWTEAQVGVPLKVVTAGV